MTKTAQLYELNRAFVITHLAEGIEFEAMTEQPSKDLLAEVFRGLFIF